MHVTFDNGITGDLGKREISFHDNVKAVYGPVTRWNEELDADRRGGLGEEGITLTCDTLTLAEMGPKVEDR